MRNKNFIKNIFFVIALCALLVLVWRIGWGSIVKNVSNTGYWFIAIAGVWIFVYLVNTLSFKYIVCDNNNKKAIGFWKLMQITISGFALNYATPAGIMGGIPYRIMELKNYVGGKKATSSVLLYTIMHMMGHIIFWISAILVVALYITMSKELMIILVLVFLGCAALFAAILLGYQRGILIKLFQLLGKTPLLKKPANKYFLSHQEEIVVIDNQISDLYINRRKIFYRVLILELAGRLINCLEVYFIINAVGIEATYFHALVMVAMTTLLANIFFFFPMQIGPREVGFAGTIELLKIVPKAGTMVSLGVYVSLVTRIRELFWIGIGLLLMRIKSIK